MLQSSNHPLIIKTNTTERLRCDGDGVKVHNGRFYSAGTFAYIESSSTSHTTLTLRKTASGADAIDYLQLRDNSNALKLKIGGDGIIYTPDVLASHEGDTDTKIRFPAANIFSVETGGTERARINANGKLLINHDTARGVGGSAFRQLQIEGTTAGTSGASIVRNSADSSPPSLDFGKSRASSVGGTTIVQDDDVLGTISFCGADGTNLQTNAVVIRAEVDGTPGENDMPGRIIFKTTADGAASSTERLRITSAGNIYTDGDQVRDDARLTITNNAVGVSTSIFLPFFKESNGTLIRSFFLKGKKCRVVLG